MSDKGSILDDVVDIAGAIGDLYDENQEKIERILGSPKEVPIGSSDMLTTVERKEEEVKIVVDTEGGSLSDVDTQVDGKENMLEVSVPGDSIKFRLPNDCNMNSVEMKFKNGVMDITVPRENRGE